MFGWVERVEELIDDLASVRVCGIRGMFGVGDGVFEESGFVFGEVGEADFGADFLTPETIDAGIDGDACDPVRERLVGAERIDAGEDLEEDILSDVLFVGGAWEVGADDADDVRVEGLDERACCGFAAVADEGDEAVPVRRGRGIRVQHEGIWDWRRRAGELVTDRNAKRGMKERRARRQARMPLMGLQGSTPVRRASRPWNLTEKRE